MFERTADRWQVAMLLAALLPGLWAWGQLPPGAQVPIHFNVQGVPDGWGSPAMGFLVMPGVAAAMWGLRGLLDKAEPSAGAADRERVARALDQIFLAMTGLFAMIQLIIVAVALSDWRPAAAHFLLPVALVLLAMGRASLRLVDPGDPKLAPSSGALRTLRWAGPASLFLVFVVIACQALDVGQLSPNLLLLSTGLLLAVTGNVMGKLRPNASVGIRTRWTLANARVWDQTHRFGGKAQVAAGVVLVGLALTPLPPVWHGPAVVLLALAASGAAALKSYWLWRKLPPEDREPCRGTQGDA
jgi:hypothetical protein